MMREWFSATDLAGLPGVPGTSRGITKAANRENWTFRKRAGRGGGREYHIKSLPLKTASHLRSVAGCIQQARAKIGEAAADGVKPAAQQSQSHLVDLVLRRVEADLAAFIGGLRTREEVLEDLSQALGALGWYLDALAKGGEDA